MSNRFPTERRATIRDVAAKAGVSIATVSKYFNKGDYYIADATKQRIAEAILQLDYEPSATARGLVSRRSRAIGVVIASFDNPFYAQLIAGVDDVIGATDFTMVVASTADDPKAQAEVVQSMRQRQVEGMLLASLTSESPEVAKALRSGIDVVLASRVSADLNVDAFVGDNVGGAMEVVRHLAGHGHRRIAHVAGPQNVTSFSMRAEGFRRGCDEAGLDATTATISLVSEASVDAGEAAAGALLDSAEPPTAIFAANDRVALGVLRAAERRGLGVPGDLAVVGFDNIWVADMPGVHLSSVDADTRDTGRQAARRLLERIERRWADGGADVLEAEQHTLPARFIARHTCGC
ncbi:LacI family DNA-binding transcriptional regulator [Pseudactinotalea sp.]|uniref:LacI family DNA-binding transcriptional regulator n=1 Tax=Pseudactinotalea sp. TaxID=1926260 RepID=UPI003B3A74B0